MVQGLHGLCWKYRGIPGYKYDLDLHSNFFSRICLQDSLTGLRFAQNVSDFLASINLAVTFDRQLFEAHGAKMAAEFKGKGANVIIGPMMNIMRSPIDGRNWKGVKAVD